jgi:hypothetical protein
MKYGDYSHKEPVVVFDKLLKSRLAKGFNAFFGPGLVSPGIVIEKLELPPNYSTDTPKVMLGELLVTDPALWWKRLVFVSECSKETVWAIGTLRLLQLFKDVEDGICDDLTAERTQGAKMGRVFMKTAEDGSVSYCGFSEQYADALETAFYRSGKKLQDKERQVGKWYRTSMKKIPELDRKLIERYLGQILTLGVRGLQIEPLYTPLNWELLDRYVQTKT